MKKLLILSLILSASFANAKTVARVLGVEGNAFNFMSSKKAKQLIYGSKIEDASVVMVEDGATLSIKDEAGRVYHLGGGTQVKLFSKLIEVQKGYLWVSSKLSSIGTISSANAVVKYTQGQFIFNFDNYRSKSQVMALTGNVQLSNSVEPELLVEIPAGHFSFIDNKVNEGMPRGATRVGLTSYKSFKSVFDNNDRIQHKSFERAFGTEAEPARAIASVTPKKAKGKILYFGNNTARIPASASPNAMSYYKSVTTPKKVVKKVKKVKVRVFGLDDAPTRSVASTSPAENKVSESSPESEGGSFFKRREERMKLKRELEEMQKRKIAAKYKAEEEKRRKPSSVNPYGDKASAFEQSLKESESQNRRHTTERSSLIDELKSYNKAYKKQY